MKIALEEHFVIPGFHDYLATSMPAVTPEAYDRLVALLSDFGDQRLTAMEAAGLDVAVLSLSGPGVQIEPDTAVAVRLARQANDQLAVEVQRRPERYAGFAHLPMQDPKASADELDRSVRDLGFAGAMVNGHSNGVYLDDPRYDAFWERMQALDVPLYLHPDNAYVKPYAMEGCDELLKAIWEWNCETSTHFLRLLFSGVFDRFPRLKVILGHMGETLPYVLWRLDSRAALNTKNRPLKLPPSAYLRRNLYVTTSGQCDDVPLIAALSALGEDHVLFSIDYPYEDSATAGHFIERAAIGSVVREKVCSGNARAIMPLKAAVHAKPRAALRSASPPIAGISKSRETL
jgi:2,3-dihydroxybenzoate decarboxylase